LEDGVLYFYRNKHEGESSEARLERNNSRSVFDDVYDLSKSPMPRPSRLLLTSPDNHNQFLWEKRVALENVGAVRSAELEFGPNSFELVANVIDDEEDEDNNRYKNHSDDEDDHNGSNKLILRAASQKEMQEWLFQFHRSVARYFMKLVEGISHQNNFMDLHHPSFQQPRMMTAPISPSPHDSPVLHPGSLMLSAFSPRLRMPQSSVPLNAQPSTSLSHGHGRIAMRRRRVDDRSKTSADQVTKPRNYRDVSPGESTPEHDTMQTLPFSMTPSEEQARVPDSVFYPRTLPALPSPTETSPEISAPMSVCPETERPRPSAGKYIPPHLRNQQQQNGNTGSTGGKYVPPSVRRRQQQQAAEKGNDIKLLSLQERAAVTPHHQQAYSQEDAVSDVSLDPQLESAGWEQSPVTNLANCVPLKLGGCADPLVAVGSILDTIYTSKKASKVGKVFTEPFGCLSGDAVAVPTKSVGRAGGLQWEIGAVSECGVRESNEDSYVIAADLHLMLDSLCDDSSASSSGTNKEKTSSRNSLFALFDGHCGNQAARFAAEKLPTLIRDQYTVDGVFVGSFGSPSKIEEALRNAIVRLDEDFCRLCVEGGRDWESGTTALVAMLANENLVIANVGDCRGVVCRCVDDSSSSMASHLEQNGWKKLNISNKVDESDDEDEDSKWMRAMASDPDDEDNGSAKKPASKSCYWRQVTDVHSPGRATERARIEGANGWITTETEIPIGQLHRVDLWDGDVIEILKRCLSDPRILQIARVCGELAVSRAIGDRDFKAAYNKKSESAADNNVGGWDSPLFLPYPDEHNRSFVGDLVSGVPDFDTLKVGEPGISDEFLLLACDGLWDVLVRHCLAGIF
jgi:serine/threonine protein phosphatase PrpC